MTGMTMLRCALTLLGVGVTWGQLAPVSRPRPARLMPVSRPRYSIFTQASSCQDFVCPAVRNKQWNRVFPGLFHRKRQLKRLLRQKYTPETKVKKLPAPSVPRKARAADCNNDEIAVYSSCCTTCVGISNATTAQALVGGSVEVVQYNGMQQFIPQARCIDNGCDDGCIIDMVPHTVLVCDPEKPDEPYFTPVWCAGVCSCPN